MNHYRRSWLSIAGVTVALLALLVTGLSPNAAEARAATAVASGAAIHHTTAEANVVPMADAVLPTGSLSGSPSTYGYYETLYHLPGYNPMSSFLNNMNGKDEQIPTLTSGPSQPPGVYYVDNASNFDILFLENSTVRTIAHVVPLYQRFGYNGMLDNEFFVEYGYDEALFFGTTILGGSTYSIEIVNLTTGSVLLWNTTAPIDGTNQQPIYVGNNTVIVLSSNDTIVGYNLASHARWSAGTTSYFEANNIYWIPQLRQLINVEAEGSSGDGVQQLNASVDAIGHVRFSIVTNLAVDSGVRFNFVDGIGYNASLRQLAFSAGYFRGNTVYTYVLQYEPSYVLSHSLAAKYTVLPGSTPQLLTGQRYVYTSEYVLGWNVAGVQYLFDPWSGATVATNRTFQEGVACSNACFESLYAPSPNYLLDYNASLRNETAFYNVVYAYHNAASPYPNTHKVTFRESGLPSGLRWKVTVNGVTKSLVTDGATDTLLFLEPNGAYGYTIAGNPGWHESTLPYRGRVVVSGASVTEPTLAYTRVTSRVTFSESGLPSGLRWKVTLNGVTKSLVTNGDSDSLTWTGLPHGTYAYSITRISGWHQKTLPSIGSVVVSADSVREPTLVYT